MDGYIRKVNYYETDKMGIVHHSNYIRFMEEARMQYLDDIGFPMERVESMGIISPVVNTHCEYKRPCTFGDEIGIEVNIEEYTGVKLKLSYIMRNVRNNEIISLAYSTHCFTNTTGQPIIIKKVMPELDKILKELKNK